MDQGSCNASGKAPGQDIPFAGEGFGHDDGHDGGNEPGQDMRPLQNAYILQGYNMRIKIFKFSAWVQWNRQKNE